MSAEKKYTEREKILAQRSAFVTGVNALWIEPAIKTTPVTLATVDRVEKKADELYPLPKVTRPRTREDDAGNTWRYTEEHGLQVHSGDINLWTEANGAWLKHDNARAVVADLLANPTETVEDAS